MDGLQVDPCYSEARARDLLQPGYKEVHDGLRGLVTCSTWRVTGGIATSGVPLGT